MPVNPSQKQAKNTTKQQASNFSRFVLGWDQFQDSFQMQIGTDGMSSLPSVTGLIFTFIMLVITSFYASRKVDQLINRKEVDVASTI